MRADMLRGDWGLTLERTIFKQMGLKDWLGASYRFNH